MSLFAWSPIQKVLEDLGASPEGETGWWEEAVARGLLEDALDGDADGTGAEAVAP